MNNILKPSIRYGLILAVVSIVAGTLLTLVEMNLMLMGILFLVVVLGPMVFWVLFAIRVRKANNNTFSYQQALLSLVIIAFISMFLGQVWNTVYIKYINPGMIEQMAEKTAEGMIEMGMSADDPQIEETVRQIEESNDMGVQWRKFMWNTVVMLVLSLIIAAIIKKQPGQSDNLNAAM
ncbi:MAG: DUF4199 domain-containing protein [Flavobacteriales bacterium]